MCKLTVHVLTSAILLTKWIQMTIIRINAKNVDKQNHKFNVSEVTLPMSIQRLLTWRRYGKLLVILNCQVSLHDSINVIFLHNNARPRYRATVQHFWKNTHLLSQEDSYRTCFCPKICHSQQPVSLAVSDYKPGKTACLAVTQCINLPAPTSKAYYI